MRLTCAECSSLGLDKATGSEPLVVPEKGRCDSCGGPWPARPDRSLRDVVEETRAEILDSFSEPKE